jgi:GNAT superfamily N-acetyltransferase
VLLRLAQDITAHKGCQRGPCVFRVVMILREAALDDVPVLADAWYGMLDEAALLAQVVEPSWRQLVIEEFSRGIAKGRHRWMVAEADGRIVATGGLFLRRDPVAMALTGVTATIAGVYTWSPYRRRGFAAAIVRRLIDLAREEGCLSVRLRASAQGRALYEALGFQSGDDMYLPLH